MKPAIHGRENVPGFAEHHHQDTAASMEPSVTDGSTSPGASLVYLTDRGPQWSGPLQAERLRSWLPCGSASGNPQWGPPFRTGVLPPLW